MRKTYLIIESSYLSQPLTNNGFKLYKPYSLVKSDPRPQPLVQSEFSQEEWKRLDTIYTLALNQESKLMKERVATSIRAKLHDLLELLQVVTVGEHVLIKSKPKFDDEEEGSQQGPVEVRLNSNRGSQYRGVSRNGKKWQVSVNNNTPN